MRRNLAQDRLPRQSGLWVWLLFLVLALLPFVLRLGIDTEVVKQQSVLDLYRDWRWSDQASRLEPGSEIAFQRVDRLSSHEDYFEAQLQKDFVVKPQLAPERVRAFFSQGSSLRARIELWDKDQKEWVAWSGESRLTNNGILVGPWIAIVLILLGAGYQFSLLFGLSSSLLWASRWNPLEIPIYLYNFLEVNLSEAYKRVVSGSWQIEDLSRIPEFSVFVWLLLTLPFAAYLLKRESSSQLPKVLGLSFLFEPVAIALSAYFASWPSDAAWWKVYAGSMAYRFFTLSIILVFYFDRRLFQRFKDFSKLKLKPSLWMAMLAPIVFLMCKGWSWLNAVLLVNVGDSLLRMKIFVVGLLLGFFVGSRVFSLWLGTLALSMMLPPTKGHWFAASLYGFFFDAVLLGWFLSPFKVLQTPFVTPLPAKQLTVVFVMTWVLGVFLTSVGVNLPITWLLLGLSLWAYVQLQQSQKPFSPGPASAQASS